MTSSKGAAKIEDNTAFYEAIARKSTVAEAKKTTQAVNQQGKLHNENAPSKTSTKKDLKKTKSSEMVKGGVNRVQARHRYLEANAIVSVLLIIIIIMAVALKNSFWNPPEVHKLTTSTANESVTNFVTNATTEETTTEYFEECGERQIEKKLKASLDVKQMPAYSIEIDKSPDSKIQIYGAIITYYEADPDYDDVLLQYTASKFPYIRFYWYGFPIYVHLSNATSKKTNAEALWIVYSIDMVFRLSNYLNDVTLRPCNLTMHMRAERSDDSVLKCPKEKKSAKECIKIPRDNITSVIGVITTLQRHIMYDFMSKVLNYEDIGQDLRSFPCFTTKYISIIPNTTCNTKTEAPKEGTDMDDYFESLIV